MKKTDVIEVGGLYENDIEKMRWKDFEVHQLIAIQREMEEGIAKSSNK